MATLLSHFQGAGWSGEPKCESDKALRLSAPMYGGQTIQILNLGIGVRVRRWKEKKDLTYSITPVYARKHFPVYACEHKTLIFNVRLRET